MARSVRQIHTEMAPLVAKGIVKSVIGRDVSAEVERLTALSAEKQQAVEHGQREEDR